MMIVRARALLLVASCLLALATGAGAQEGAAVSRAHLTPDQEFPGTADLWTRSTQAEAENRHLDAAAFREKILAQHPNQVHTRWRTARDLIRGAEDYLEKNPDKAIELVKRGRAHAQAGRRADPACSECCFYDFANVAREAATSGMMSSLPLIREMNQRLLQDMSNRTFFKRFGANLAQLKTLACEIVDQSGIDVSVPFRRSTASGIIENAFATVFATTTPEPKGVVIPPKFKRGSASEQPQESTITQ